MGERLKSALPYMLTLLLCAGLYYFTTRITFTERPGQLGPEFWPRVAIGLMAAVAVVEILRILISGRVAGTLAVAEDFDGGGEADSDAEHGQGRRQNGLALAGGIALTLAYAALVPVLGFIAASFAFVVLFMYLAGVRNHLAVWLAGTGGVLALAFVFLKVVYVSMPRGVPPFDQITQAVMELFLIR